MAIKDDLKSILSKNGITLTMIVDELNKVNEDSTTVQNLSNKLSRGTIKYTEVEQILSIIGYSIEWKSNNEYSQLKHPSISSRNYIDNYHQIKYDYLSESPEEYIIEQKLAKYIDESMHEVFKKIVKLNNELMNKKEDK